MTAINRLGLMVIIVPLVPYYLTVTVRFGLFVGLRPCEFYGNFNMNNTTDVELALVNSQTVIMSFNIACLSLQTMYIIFQNITMYSCLPP